MAPKRRRAAPVPAAWARAYPAYRVAAADTAPTFAGRPFFDRVVLPLLADAAALPRPVVLAVSGGQGSGKSTLARLLCLTAAQAWGARAVTVSLDDFYLARAARQFLAAEVHPLLATRGVPGTHDTARLAQTLQRLKQLGAGETCALPVFDKAHDDPAADPRLVTGPLDLIVVEGWCLGATPQTAADLAHPINDLERTHDPEGRWRTWVNDRLAAAYVPLWAAFDLLVFLQVPDMDAVVRWRHEQETRLAQAGGEGAGRLPDRAAVAAFVAHYERLTRHMQHTLPTTAHRTIPLTPHHAPHQFPPA